MAEEFPGLSEEEEITIKTLRRQPWSAAFYEAFAGTCPQIAVEAVIVRKGIDGKKIEVLLIPRPPADTAYPGQLHCPGTIKRNRELPEDALVRLNEKEVKSPFVAIKDVGYVSLPTEERGDFLCLVFLCRINGESPSGEFYPIDALPENTVASHRKHIIPLAAKHVEEFFERGNDLNPLAVI